MGNNGPIFISIGGNLPGTDGRSALVNCAAAAESLRALPGLRLAALSGWYATDPIPAGSGPRYVNGVAWMVGEVDPAWLLQRLQGIEARAGRVRSVANAPRVLDLDIIAMGALVRDSPDPILPHPRAHLRRFVLEPLAELCPDWTHPRLGQSIAALLAALPAQGVERM
jgi:2-amino-4-hydroxy-6-hydroxymethyldihydropteridine diphosphokinase